MPPLPREAVTQPIKLFTGVTPAEINEALNELVNDTNAALATSGGGGATYQSFTVAGLAGAPTSEIVMATDGRKVGLAEGPGAGTGVLVYFSLGAWRTISTDAPVQA